LKDKDLLNIREHIKRFIFDNYDDSYFPKSESSGTFGNMFSSYGNSIGVFISENKNTENLKYFLSNLIRTHESTQQKVSDITLIDKGNLSKIINEKIEMSKDTCVKIALALKLSKNEYEKLFKLSKISLYNKDERDLILMYILKNQSKFMDNYNKPDTVGINEVLEGFKKNPLF
jgi:plasmid maintenance system antidote protein VapI